MAGIGLFVGILGIAAAGHAHAITYTEDLCTGGTPTAIGYYSTYTPSKAFDDSTADGSSWVDNEGFPVWIQYQFTEAKQIEKLTVVTEDNGEGQSSKNFLLRGSNNGVDFTTVLDDILTAQANKYKHEFTFENANSYTYYRLVIEDAWRASVWCNLFEIEMMEEAPLEPFSFSENFDSYTAGITINGQGGWVSGGSNDSVSTTQHYDGTKSLTGYQPYKTFEAANEGQISYYAYASSGSGNDNILFLSASTNLSSGWQCGVFLHSEDNQVWYKYDGGYHVQGFSYVSNTWIHVQFAFKINDGNLQCRFNFGDTTWSDWFDAEHYDTYNYVDYIVISNGNGGSFIDAINSEEISTSCEERETEQDCIDNDCYWYGSSCNSEAPDSCSTYGSFLSCYNDNRCCWNYNNTCFDCNNTELCQNTLDGCYYCLEEEDCEAESCYWTGTACVFGGSSCNAYNLSGCTSQGDCEGVGGVWYSGVCTAAGYNTPIQSWSDYYEDHGTGETPSEIISDIASVFQSFLDKIGKFLIVFNSTFDPADASKYGSSLGDIIPEARGFLVVIDDFIGEGLPIAEILVFCLLVLLGITIFRGFKSIWSAIRG